MRRYLYASILSSAVLLAASAYQPTYAHAASVHPLCGRSGYTMTPPAGWKVDVRGCTGGNTPLLLSPDKKAGIAVATTALGTARATKIDIATLRALFAASGYTVVNPGYVVANGITFTVGTMYLVDPATKQDVTFYYAATIHAHTMYAFMASIVRAKNPSYGAEFRAVKHVLTTFRFVA
jgi:hypothetical protein